MVVQVTVVLLYVLVNVAIGFWASRRVRNVGDFFIAGRRVGPWVSAFAYGTTYFSAVLFVGYAGKLGWGFGLNTLWIAAGNVIVGSLLAWMVLARRTRTMTTRLDALTMPEFLAARYGWAPLKAIAALVVFVFLVPYSASVYTGLGHLFSVNFGIPFIYAQVFMAVLTAVYLLMGGYLAVTVTDLFQGLVQVLGVSFMIYFVVAPHGSLGTAFSTVAADPGNAPGLSAPGPFPGWLVLSALVLITSLGPWGLPQMVQKFYSIKTLAAIKPAMLISTLFAVLIAGTAYFVGAMSHLYFEAPGGPGLLPVVPKDPDTIIPTMLADPSRIPAWFSALILVVVLAASMSTLASLVLVSSAAISVDLLGLRVKGADADRRGVLVMRLLCGVFVGLSVVLASAKVMVIVNLMVISWGALAGCFLAPYLYGLFWRRANLPGAIAGMAAGLGSAITLFSLWGKPGIPVAGAVAILLPLVVVPVVTLLTPRPADDHVQRVFGDGESAEAVE